MLLLVCVLLLSLRLAAAQASPPQPQASMRVVQDDGVWWFQDGTGAVLLPGRELCRGVLRPCRGDPDAPGTPAVDRGPGARLGV